MSSWAVSLSPACRAASSSADNRLEGSEGPSLALPLGSAGTQTLGVGGFHEHSCDLIHCQLTRRPHLRHSPPWECDFTMLCFPGPGNSASESSRCWVEPELCMDLSNHPANTFGIFIGPLGICGYGGKDWTYWNIWAELLQTDPFTIAWSATVGGGVVDPPASHTQGIKFG